jgi:hypothetical protein
MAIRFEDKPKDGAKPVRRPVLAGDEASGSADRPFATELPMSHPKAEPKGKPKRKSR